MIDDHSEGSVMGKHFVLPVLEEGYPSPSRQGPSQGFTFRVVSTTITDRSAVYYCRSGDGPRTARQCSPRNISFLQR
jgi:hypothetical protein